jgi:hypothetical protein
VAAGAAGAVGAGAGLLGAVVCACAMGMYIAAAEIIATLKALNLPVSMVYRCRNFIQ